jgi:hypothetical protein
MSSQTAANRRISGSSVGLLGFHGLVKEAI